MKLGILLGEFEKTMSLEDAVETARKIGYGCVELPANDLNGDGPQYTRDTAVPLIHEIRDVGLEASAFQCHFHKGFGTSGASDCVRHVLEMAEIAEECGVPVVHTVSGILTGYDPVQHERPYDPEEALGGDEWRRMTASYKEIVAQCSSAHVKIAIEPVFVYLVCNTRTAEALLDEVGGGPLFINFDPSHFPYHDEDPTEFARVFSDKIVHAHVKDALVEPATGQSDTFPISGGRVFNFAAPGKGVLNWELIIDTLRNIGYDEVLSLEMGHGYVGDPRDIAEDNLAFFRGLGV